MSTAAPLLAELRPPPVAPNVPLMLPDEPRTADAPPAPPPKIRPLPPAPGKAAPWTEVVKQHLRQLQAKGLFYPTEAIARGQQGDVLVFMLIDESGAVAAARVEESSGFPLLDAAALSAVRSLRSLPADAPREALLPVRFRLK